MPPRFSFNNDLTSGVNVPLDEIVPYEVPQNNELTICSSSAASVPSASSYTQNELS
jgi:hypothetical protein